MNRPRTLTVAIAVYIALFVSIISYIVSESGPPINTPPPEWVTLTSEERANLQTHVDKLETEIQKLEQQLPKTVENQRWFLQRLSAAVIEFDDNHRLHPDLYDRLGPPSFLQLPDVTKMPEALAALTALETSITNLVAAGSLTQGDSWLYLNRVAALRNHIQQVEAARARLMLKWELHQEEKALDSAQLSMSDYELEQKILARQAAYDAEYPPQSSYLPPGEGWYQEQEAETRPPRPRLPAKRADPYNRRMSIPDSQAMELYKVHSLDSDTLQTRHNIAQSILAITTRLENILYNKQLLLHNARPNVH